MQKYQTTYRFATLIVSILLSLYSNAQPTCRVKTFNVENGLQSNNISGITQTSDNIIWLATPNGLGCYDGYRFATFGNTLGQSPILSTNHFASVSAGADDNIWISTYYDEVLVFNTHNCHYINVTEMIKKRYGKDFKLRKIYSLSNGATWLVGKGNTHYRITGNLEDNGEITEHVLKGILNKVSIDANGKEWCFTSNTTYVLGGKSYAMTFEHIKGIGAKTWLVSIDGKIAVSEKSSTTPKYISTSLASQALRVNDVEVLNKHILVLATSKGITVFDTRNGKMIHGSMDDGKGYENINVDTKGRVWCFSDSPGVTLCEVGKSGIKMRSLMTTGFLTTNGSRYTIGDRTLFHEDNHHTIWLIPAKGVFSYYDEQTGQLVEHLLETSNMRYGVLPSIKRYFSDHQGNLWIMGAHNLFFVDFLYHNTRFIGIDDNREVRSVIVAHDGSTILGNTDGYITRHRTDASEPEYLSPEGVWQKKKVAFSTRVYSLYEHKDGRLWIGTKTQGLYIVTPGVGVAHYVHDDNDKYSLSHDDVYDIQPDSRGRMMIATYNGGINIVKQRQDGRLSFIHSGNLLKGYDIKTYGKARRILTLKGGEVLVATSNGLITFSDRYHDYTNIRFYHSAHTDSPSSLYSSEVLQTCQTTDGSIYVITFGGGLQRLTSTDLLRDNIEVETIRTSDGRAVDFLNGEKVIKSLAADDKGNLWIIGESRVAAFRNDKLTIYSSRELGSVNITEAKPLYDTTTGRLIFAAEGGAISMRPDIMKSHHTKPSIVFTAVRYLGQDIETPLFNTPELSIDVSHRSFVLYFAAIDYIENTGIRYAYKIDDGEWNYTRAGSNSVSFNNFPAGSHTIYIRSTNTHGVWIDNERQLHIYAQPTFVESWWGRLIIAALIIGCLVALLRHYLSRKKKEITDEANEIADASKVRFVLRQPEIIDEEKAMMDKLMAFIEQHIADPDMKVDDMASALHLGRSAFYSRIKNIVDMAPNDFLRHVRMQRAEDLVRQSSLTFSQIAYSVGFTDPKYFSKCFKKHTGMTPSEYRNHITTTDTPD